MSHGPSSNTSVAGGASSFLRADLSLLRADLSLTARGTACLPPEGRHVYRPRDGMFTARGAVSNESAGKSDEALGKSIATADRNEVVFPADTVFPQRPDKTHHYISYYI